AGKGRDAFLRQELEGTVLVLPHRPLQKARLGIVFKRLYGGDEQEYEADVERELPETGRAGDTGDSVYHLLQDARDEQVQPGGEQRGAQGQGKVQPVPAEKLCAARRGVTLHGAPSPRARRA